jgi:hypothetical protein
MIGLIGIVYGSSPKESDHSFTEIEYDAAVQAEVPRLMFLTRDDFPLPGNLREGDAKWTKQQAFRERIKKESMVAADAIIAGLWRASARWELGDTPPIPILVPRPRVDRGRNPSPRTRASAIPAAALSSWHDSVSIGETRSGFLSRRDQVIAGSQIRQVWVVDGRVGQIVRIDLESDDFDTYLYIAGPEIRDLSDDDSGDGTNSQITVRFAQTATYFIVVSSFGGNEVGSFTLTVRSPW